MIGQFALGDTVRMKKPHACGAEGLRNVSVGAPKCERKGVTLGLQNVSKRAPKK